MGSVPMLIADGLELPFEDQINWSEFIIRVPEGSAHRANEFIPDTQALKEMSEKGYRMYMANFSNQNLYKSIANRLATLEIR